MNKYTKKYRKIVRGLIKESFPELKKVYVYEFNLGKNYSGIAFYLSFFKFIVLGKKLR